MSIDIEMTVSEYTDSDSEYFPSEGTDSSSSETDTSLDTIYPEEIEDLYKELEEDIRCGACGAPSCACFVPFSFLYAHE